ncbi:2,3-diketo-5-methylthio-1-phosphopentane phosphatase [Mytilinidion resinicola]|uniref:2,3-diketo-5-methylthio-1-phosphopentane phosphatase n=1 Tax=Mytilinidion resinicola TaxID=574789 RepID=A0A6A6YSZ3_9PEZI|nr:2,3-diketo-5-methylthio-1-phosphopentane phosphatase [Mytilinidion resinicola]KAF2811639.1 2,3-diketo-5-methylthio-1-phosphopentane phosphatase [Mytilinidion resinicola]
MSPVAINIERWKAADIVLLDIEGTISSISFVKDTLYPYALRRLTRLAHESWEQESFQELIEGFPEETRGDAETLIAHVEELTRKDIKAVYLKQLQGKLWKQGYSNGEITTPLYPDVLTILESWLAIPKKLAIFSSGSVEAQLNFFKYIEIPQLATAELSQKGNDEAATDVLETHPTEEAQVDESKQDDTSRKCPHSPSATNPDSSDLPSSLSTKKTKTTTLEATLNESPPKTRDLNPLFINKFDTVTAGSKLEKASYEKICEELETVPEKVVFLTDNVKEATAATQAGVYTIVVDRPGNAPLADEIFDTYPVITALDQIHL